MLPDQALLTGIRPDRNEWRFYRTAVWPDLFGRALLARQWDPIGIESRLRLDPHPDKGAALNAPARLRAATTAPSRSLRPCSTARLGARHPRAAGAPWQGTRPTSRYSEPAGRRLTSPRILTRATGGDRYGPMPPSAPLVATILPPFEGFGPGQAGAVGTMVRLLSGAPGYRPLVIGGPQASVPFADVPFHAVRAARWRPGNVNIRYGAALLQTLWRAGPALIEVHNRPELAIWLARRLPTTPVLLFLHNDPQEMRRAGTSAERARLLSRLARVVVVSEYLQRRLLEGISQPARAPVVLPNAIELSALPPPRAREPLILFAGRVVRDKAPDVFVAACATALPELADWRAELIGADRFHIDSPETAFTNVIRADAERAGVRAVGYRNHASVLDAMARAAMVVVPSRWQEPFGLVALEAMASGAALISSSRGGLREVAGDVALYIDPDDPPAVAAAICSLAADPPRRAAMGQAGRVRAAAFDAPVIAGRLAALRREVLAGAGG